MTEYRISAEQIIDDYNDLDIYTIEYSTQFNTNQVSIVINFREELIGGEKVAYGMWYDIDEQETMQYLALIEKEGKLLREVPLTTLAKYNQLVELIKPAIEEVDSIGQFESNYIHHEEHLDLDDYIDYIVENADFEFEKILESFEYFRQVNDARFIQYQDCLHVFFNENREL